MDLIIKQAALICHSAGDICFLDSLYNLPHVLNPQCPYAAALVRKKKLALKTFWAEDNIMIGRDGEQYFDKCFGRKDVDKSIDYEGRMV